MAVLFTPKSTEDVVKLITLILMKNNFSFNDEDYLQLKGMAMGTCMAPSYENIFMVNLERRILAKWMQYNPLGGGTLRMFSLFSHTARNN